MSTRTPTEKLNAEEIARIKALRDAKTAAGAAKALGLHKGTVLAVLAGEAVHRQTARAIRAYFASAL